MTLADGVESWLQRLQDVVGTTLKDLNSRILADSERGVRMEEWAYKARIRLPAAGLTRLVLCFCLISTLKEWK